MNDSRHSQDRCCLRPPDGGSAFRSRRFRGHQWVYLHYGPVTCSPSYKDGFVDKLQKFSFLSPCYPSYGAPNFYPGGIFPTEHTSLRWTHVRRSQFGPLHRPMQDAELVTKSDVLRLESRSRFEDCQGFGGHQMTALEAKRRQQRRSNKLHILM